jgi:hypothetical protein
MSDVVAMLFERELRRKGVLFRFDDESQRYVVQLEGRDLWVSLDNLARAYQGDREEAHVVRFVDAVLTTRSEMQSWQAVQSSILFSLEPSDYADPPDFRTPISRRVDRVPVLIEPSMATIAWVTPRMLECWQVSLADVEAEASRNLAAALAAAKLECRDVDGVRVGFVSTPLPHKSALILAPNVKEVVSPALGWPLHAVTPDRNFLYLWAAHHQEFLGRVGRVVVDEFVKSPYPITTEVFEIGDGGIKAVGAFPVPA